MKFLALHFLLPLYLLASLGLKVNAHWCGESLTSFELFSHEGDRHCACPPQEDAGCCKDLSCNMPSLQHQSCRATQTEMGTRASVKALPEPHHYVYHAGLATELSAQKWASYDARAACDGDDRYLYLHINCLRT